MSVPIITSPEGNGADTGDIFAARNRWLEFSLMALTAAVTAFSMPFFHNHGISAGRDVFNTFADHGLSQNGRRCGAVARHVIRLGSDFLNELSAHIFKCVLKFNFLGDGHAVVCDQGRAELFI